MRACGRCLMLKEWDDDALHDGRPAGPASGRRDDVGSPPPRGVRGMSGRGGGAVPACRAAQGAAGAPAGARPLARRARGGARRTPAAAQPLGPVEPRGGGGRGRAHRAPSRSEEHTSELQSLTNLVCRLLLEKKKKKTKNHHVRSAIIETLLLQIAPPRHLSRRPPSLPPSEPLPVY